MSIFFYIDDNFKYRSSIRLKAINKKKNQVIKLITFKPEENKLIYSSALKWKIIFEKNRTEIDATHVYNQVIILEAMNENEISFVSRIPCNINIPF